jgi:hypothetical protein
LLRFSASPDTDRWSVRAVTQQELSMRQLLLTAAAVGLIAACSSTDATPVAAPALAEQGDAHASHGRASNNGDLTPEQKKAVAAVRNATARFHDIEATKAAGYLKQYPPGCAESAEGAQGFHYLNEGLVDGTVELLKPELVMYEPQPNGKLQLIGVDYVVPLTSSATPPTLLGVEFARNEPLGVWALHIWSARPNPSGMFAAWNPKVSCRHASRATP